VSPSTEEDFMVALMWNLSVATRRYLRTYMPSNIAIDLLRTHRGLKWALPVAVLAVPAYLIAAAMASSTVEDSGPQWLYLVVIALVWNGMKFAWVGALTPFTWLGMRRVGSTGVGQ
jgi:hypothetical protein